MQIESIQELDRMRMMSIQALAMQRIRASVASLSRETGFQERPIEAFAQAPLYIPQYQKWSNRLGKIVGTPPPTKPQELIGYDFSKPAAEEYHGRWFIWKPIERRGRIEPRRISTTEAEARQWSNLVTGWQSKYAAWKQAQRNLPT